MRTVDLSLGAGHLRASADLLLLRWNETREQWRDANSRHLEETRLQPLIEEIAAAESAIRHMNDVLRQAHRECGDW